MYKEIPVEQKLFKENIATFAIQGKAKTSCHAVYLPEFFEPEDTELNTERKYAIFPLTVRFGILLYARVMLKARET